MADNRHLDLGFALTADVLTVSAAGSAWFLRCEAALLLRSSDARLEPSLVTEALCDGAALPPGSSAAAAARNERPMPGASGSMAAGHQKLSVSSGFRGKPWIEGSFPAVSGAFQAALICSHPSLLCPAAPGPFPLPAAHCGADASRTLRTAVPGRRPPAACAAGLKETRLLQPLLPEAVAAAHKYGGTWR